MAVKCGACSQKKVQRSCPELSAEMKAKAVVRLLRAIQKASGGIFGDRNYLEMIHSMFTGKGKWSALFDRE